MSEEVITLGGFIECLRKLVEQNGINILNKPICIVSGVETIREVNARLGKVLCLPILGLAQAGDAIGIQTTEIGNIVGAYNAAKN